MRNILNFVLLLITIYTYVYCPHDVNVEYMWLQIVIMLCSIFLFFTGKDAVSLKKDTLRLSVIFIIGHVIVYFQKDVDFLLGYTDMSNQIMWYDEKVVCKCMAISNIALQCFMMGYFFKQKKQSVALERFYKYSFSNIKLLNYATFTLLFLFLVFVEKKWFLGGYGKYDMGVVADYCYRFAQGFLTASFALKSIQYRQEKSSKGIKSYFICMRSQLFLSLLFIGLISISGARHLAILMLFINIIAFTFATRYQFKIRQILIGVVILGTLLTLRGITRRSDYSGNLASVELNESVNPFTEELSNSIMALHAAVSFVPDVYPYNYGLTLLPKPFLIIPGAASLVQSLLGLNSVTANSSGLITTWVLGDNPSFGMGSCSVADIYICFGVLGVVFVFFIWGIFIRYIENGLYVTNKLSPYFVIVAFVVYSQVLYVSRESLLTTLQGIAYPLLFCFVFCKVKKENVRKI